jgi:integrase
MARIRKIPRIKITETVRAARLRHPLKPSISLDAEIPGFALHVTKRRAFWALTFQPRGVNPATGKRWGGGVRHELGDAFQISVDKARALALEARAAVRIGRDPHRERLASRAALEAARAVQPQTIADALSLYQQVIDGRAKIAARTKVQQSRYAAKALRLCGLPDNAPVSALDVHAVRAMLDGLGGAGDYERRFVFAALRRFIAWCRRRAFLDVDPCDQLDNEELPPIGSPRDHVPTVETFRAIWRAVEDEPGRDLFRFLLLVPLRRSEATGLRGSEIDLAGRMIRIGGARMRNRKPHELPLSDAALEILASHSLTSGAVFPKFHWGRTVERIRARLGEADRDRRDRFTFHDVRRAFVSYLASRFDVDLLDQCLSHTRKGVFGVYQRASRMPERARALAAWADMIVGAEPSFNVVNLRG